MAITELPDVAIRFMNRSGQPQSHGATLMGTNKAELLQLEGTDPVQPYAMYCSRQLAIDPAENMRTDGNFARMVAMVAPRAKMISFDSCAGESRERYSESNAASSSSLAFTSMRNDPPGKAWNTSLMAGINPIPFPRNGNVRPPSNV